MILKHHRALKETVHMRVQDVRGREMQNTKRTVVKHKAPTALWWIAALHIEPLFHSVDKTNSSGESNVRC